MNNSTIKQTLFLMLGLHLGLASSSSAQENTSGVDLPDQPEFNLGDPAEHGRQVAAYADQRDEGWLDEVSQGRMTLFDAGGDSVERVYSRSLLEGTLKGDKAIVKFLSPAEIRGVAALTHEHPGDSDDNWLYLPANKRVRRISGANKTASFQGTEFTYEDLSNLAIVEYDWRFMDQVEIERKGKQVKVYRVEAKPNYKNTAYSRLVVYYNLENWRRERIEYYDKSQVLLKTQELKRWTHHHGRFWRAAEILMTNHQTGKRTRLNSDKVYLNLSLYKSSRSGKQRNNLNDSRFTTQALQK